MDKKRPTLLLLSTTRLSFCDLCSAAAAAAAAATDDRYNGKRGRRRLLIFKAPLCHSLANKLLLTDANACANEVSAVAPAAAAAAAGSAAINCDERAWKRNGQQSVVTCAYVHQKREE
ncbi:hypothetical protein TSPI_09679 [Trichinella spiralis]|uniref:Secreted protein n=1 Tax=Trichinella spiralis TaxID=6334 RepID=A0ABR3KS26_TRISP